MRRCTAPSAPSTRERDHLGDDEDAVGGEEGRQLADAHGRRHVAGRSRRPRTTRARASSSARGPRAAAPRRAVTPHHDQGEQSAEPDGTRRACAARSRLTARSWSAPSVRRAPRWASGTSPERTPTATKASAVRLRTAKQMAVAAAADERDRQPGASDGNVGEEGAELLTVGVVECRAPSLWRLWNSRTRWMPTRPSTLRRTRGRDIRGAIEGLAARCQGEAGEHERAESCRPRRGRPALWRSAPRTAPPRRGRRAGGAAPPPIESATSSAASAASRRRAGPVTQREAPHTLQLDTRGERDADLLRSAPPTMLGGYLTAALSLAARRRP